MQQKIICIMFLVCLQAAGGEAAEPGGEAAALQEQLDEQQQEFNDLLACLGQETAKVIKSAPEAGLCRLMYRVASACRHAKVERLTEGYDGSLKSVGCRVCNGLALDCICLTKCSSCGRQVVALSEALEQHGIDVEALVAAVEEEQGFGDLGGAADDADVGTGADDTDAGADANAAEAADAAAVSFGDLSPEHAAASEPVDTAFVEQAPAVGVDNSNVAATAEAEGEYHGAAQGDAGEWGAEGQWPAEQQPAQQHSDQHQQWDEHPDELYADEQYTDEQYADENRSGEQLAVEQHDQHAAEAVMPAQEHEAGAAGQQASEEPAAADAARDWDPVHGSGDRLQAAAGGVGPAQHGHSSSGAAAGQQADHQQQHEEWGAAEWGAPAASQLQPQPQLQPAADEWGPVAEDWGNGGSASAGSLATAGTPVEQVCSSMRPDRSSDGLNLF